jgi:hypothetical protein
MFTLPFDKKTPIQIVLESGEKIFARITRFDPSNGKVSWKDLDENWKGAISVKRVVAADPVEFKAWQDAKTAKMAPMPVEMARWSFGKSKRGPEMMEGYYYSTPILLDGKKVGEVIDEGFGGPIYSRCKDMTIQRQFDADLKEFRKNYNIDFEPLSYLLEWWEDSRPSGTSCREFCEARMKYIAGQIGTV